MPEAVDQEARSVAYQSRDIATRVAALQEAHIAECDKREQRREADHAAVLVGFAELRGMMSSRNAALYEKMWLAMGGLIGVLFVVIGYLYTHQAPVP